MIPDPGAQRAALRLLLEQLPDLSVIPIAPHGTLPGQPFVLIGMPGWTPATEAVGWDTITWPVMVCVPSDRTNDSLTATALEGLWPVVLAHLDTAVDADPSFGGVCIFSSIKRTEFDLIVIQGQEFPAQIIYLEMQGA